MPCRTEGALTVCTPTTMNWRSFKHCPTCDRRRWMLVRMAVWYGTERTCLGCGDEWIDGEMMPRPFERAWRTKSIEAAKRAPYSTRADAIQALNAEMSTYMEGA